jgi:4-hydroxy-tetrahydrodipicolinate synthase
VTATNKDKGWVRERLGGAMTALVTPFDPSGGLDERALERTVRRQIDLGIDGLVPCGTTGEGATLTADEQARVIEIVVRVAAGRVPVVAGCGSNETRRTVEAARRAAEAGADALLVVTPYYNKPNRSGMIDHFGRIAQATPLPVVVYNVPGRTGQNLGAELTLRLAEIPGVAGVKEASANLEQIAEILAARPAGFAVLSGDDSLVLPTVALGADGVISVVSNEAPAEMAALVAAARSGDLPRARELHFRLLPLMRANFVESNPVPVKTALSLLGLCGAEVRPPLGPPAEATRRVLREALEHAGLEVARA